MLRAFGMAILLGLSWPTAAYAQTTISGELSCTPSPEQRFDIAGQPGHAVVVRQGLCRFTKPGTVNGIAPVEETYTYVAIIDSAVVQWHGRNTTKMQNGDLVFVRNECRSRMASDGTESGRGCNWTYVGGTGKMKGIAGGGTSWPVNATDPKSPWAYKGTYKITP